MNGIFLADLIAKTADGKNSVPKEHGKEARIFPLSFNENHALLPVSNERKVSSPIEHRKLPVRGPPLS